MSHLLPCCLFADVSAFSSCIHARKPNSGIPSRRQRVVYLLCYDCCALSSSWKLSFLFIFTAVKSSAGWRAVRVLARGCADSTASHRAVFVEVRRGLIGSPCNFCSEQQQQRWMLAAVRQEPTWGWGWNRQMSPRCLVLASCSHTLVGLPAPGSVLCPGTCVVGEVSLLCSCISL